MSTTNSRNMTASLDAMSEALAAADESRALGLLDGWRKEGVATARLQAAILQARNIGLKKGGSPAAEVLSRYDRIQARWVQTLETSWTGKIHTLEDQLAEQGQAGLLQEARTRWLEAGQVDLYNYHCEMPLVAQVNIVSMREHGISVSCTPELAMLIAASEPKHTAYLQLPATAMRLKLVVEGTSGRSVHFREEGVTGVKREHRRHIRVACKEPVPMKIRHEKGPKWDAAIHDFSAFGLGISSAEKLPWSTGQELLCLFGMGGKELEVHGTVRWKTAADGDIRMGLELPHEHPFVHRLQMEVADRQQEVILELKKQPSPGCLLDIPVKARRF